MSGGGFGSGPFGSGSFGEWPWGLATIIDGIPAVYKDQDELAGDGALRALLEGVVPSLDGLRQKIRDYDILRDPLRAPTDNNFVKDVIVIRSDNQGDGTSIVFLSQGPDGDKFNGIRPGMTLTDTSGLIFNIKKISKSSLPSDVSNPPIDPATGQPTGKHIVVENIGYASTELIPFSSSIIVENESPSPVGAVGSIQAISSAFLLDGETFTLNDGVHSPFVFEFDKTPDGVSSGNISINISILTTDIQIASAMVDAINQTPGLNLFASNGSGSLSLVTISNYGAGSAGNIPVPPWSTTVANPGFLVTQPTGGAAGAFPLDPLGIDDGVSFAPYVFNTTGSYVDGLDIAPNRVSISWKENGVEKTGFFTADGLPGGDITQTSTISFSSSLATLAAGQIKIFNASELPIDSNSISITYSKKPAVQTEDSQIRSQNILAFLATDYGISLDRNDPEYLQRSYVNNAFKLWDVKGTSLGYDVIGKYAGYFVSAKPLYAISRSIASGLPSNYVYELPEGSPSVGKIICVPAASISDGETFTLDDGINSSKVFEFDKNASWSPSNVRVDISGATTAIQVASAITAAINSTTGLDLDANNSLGASSAVTIQNAANGSFGNVITWSETVADGGFEIIQPTGGVDSDYFTTINPGRASIDDVALDAIDLDLLCSDTSYPSVVQPITVTSAVKTRDEGSRKRFLVTVTSGVMYESFGTDGVFTDFGGNLFDVQNFSRISSTSYSFETESISTPVIGIGSVEWNVLRFTAPNTISITGLGVDVVDLGTQFSGYSGKRYRITKTFISPILSDIGNWAFIDSNGVVSYLENFRNKSGNTYTFDIVSSDVPASGPANIFYYCGVVTECNFCRSSSILVRISPEKILLHPESMNGDSLGRLIVRLKQMVPAHVRISQFLYDGGPCIASWSGISASSLITEHAYDDSPYTALYDELDFPADQISTDSAPIIASSEVNITNLNVIEEFISGEDPIVLGSWTATGIWHVTSYRYASQFRSFNYGKDDIGAMGDPGAVPPDYDTGATSTGILRSPTANVASATDVILRFRHYGDVRPGGADDNTSVFVVLESGPVTVQTITKTDLGLFATGTNGGWTIYSVSIGPAVIGAGNFHVEFSFDSITSTAGCTGEGWYVDDIEVKVVP